MKHGALAWGFAALGLLLAVPAQAADTVYYYYTDSLHSAVAVTDAQGTVIERTYYAPYGQVLNRDLRDGPGYTGHAEDPETNLVYMQQRYYDPEAGRFLSTDPVQADGEGGSFNRYEYAGDNPYRYYDPDGRMKDQDQERSPGCTGSLVAGGCGVVNMSTIIVDNTYRRGNAVGDTASAKQQLSTAEVNQLTALTCAEACTSGSAGQKAVASSILNRANSGDKQYVGYGKNVNVTNVVESGQFQGFSTNPRSIYQEALAGTLNNTSGFKSATGAVTYIVKNGVTTNATFIFHGGRPPPNTWMGRAVQSGTLIPASPAEIDGWYLYVPR